MEREVEKLQAAYFDLRGKTALITLKLPFVRIEHKSLCPNKL